MKYPCENCKLRAAYESEVADWALLALANQLLSQLARLL